MYKYKTNILGFQPQNQFYFHRPGNCVDSETRKSTPKTGQWPETGNGPGNLGTEFWKKTA
jgi:hypothetical protein